MHSEISISWPFWWRGNLSRKVKLASLISCAISMSAHLKSCSFLKPLSASTGTLYLVLQRLVSVAIVISHNLLVQKHCDGASHLGEPPGTQWSQNKELHGSFYPFLCLWTGHGQVIQAEENLFNLKSLQKLHHFLGNPAHISWGKFVRKVINLGSFPHY